MNAILKITCLLSIIASFISSAHAMKKPINRTHVTKKTSQAQKKQQSFQYSSLSSWMTEASSKCERFKNTPLRKLIMPGSHDSGTYAFNSRSKIGDDNSLPLELNKIPGVGFAISRYAKTQNLNLTQQLEAGVRYLDFRVLRENTKSGASQFYLIHGLKGNTLEHSLDEVLQFCKSHPGEKIIIDMNHLYGFRSQEDHQKLIELTKSKLGKLLARKTEKPN